MGNLIVLFGPSTAGKTELQKVISSPRFPKLVTATTRPPRKGEVNSSHYHFFSEEEFKRKVEYGDFIEWAPYNGHYYGTLKQTIQEVFESPISYNTVMEIQGVKALKEAFPTLVKTIYVAADYPSISRRLKERGSSKEEIEFRLFKAAEEELTEQYSDFADAQIWNGDEVPFHETMAKMKDILHQWDIL